MTVWAEECATTAGRPRAWWLLGLLFAVSCGADSPGADAAAPAVDGGAVACETVEVSDAIRVTNAPGSSLSPSLAWSGESLGLSWYDERDGNDVFVAVLAADGTGSTEAQRVTLPLTIAESPAITAAEGGFGLAWQQFTDGNFEIYFARVEESGSEVGAEKRVTTTAESSAKAAVVSSGDGFRVVWVEALDRGNNEEIFTARLDSAGDTVDSLVRVSDDPSISYAPSVASGGSEDAIAWHDWRSGNGDLYLARMGAAGEQIGADLQLTSDGADSFVPALAPGPEGGYAVAWHDSRGVVWDVYFRRLDATGLPVGVETKLSDSIADSTFASVAFTGSEYGVAWQQEVDANRERILFARVSASGEKLGETVVVSDGPAMSSQPSLTWTGSGFAVAWQDNRDGNYEIYLALIACQ